MNKDEKILNKDSKMLQDAINEINYGVAELRDIRMDITQKTEDVLSNFDLHQVTSFDNTVQSLSKNHYKTIDSAFKDQQSPTFPNSWNGSKSHVGSKKRKSKKGIGKIDSSYVSQSFSNSKKKEEKELENN